MSLAEKGGGGGSREGTKESDDPNMISSVLLLLLLLLCAAAVYDQTMALIGFAALLKWDDRHKIFTRRLSPSVTG